MLKMSVDRKEDAEFKKEVYAHFDSVSVKDVARIFVNGDENRRMMVRAYLSGKDQNYTSEVRRFVEQLSFFDPEELDER